MLFSATTVEKKPYEVNISPHLHTLKKGTKTPFLTINIWFKGSKICFVQIPSLQQNHINYFADSPNYHPPKSLPETLWHAPVPLLFYTEAEGTLLSWRESWKKYLPKYSFVLEVEKIFQILFCLGDWKKSHVSGTHTPKGRKQMIVFSLSVWDRKRTFKHARSTQQAIIPIILLSLAMATGFPDSLIFETMAHFLLFKAPSNITLFSCKFRILNVEKSSIKLIGSNFMNNRLFFVW